MGNMISFANGQGSQSTVGLIILLIIGVAVGTMVIIFVGVLGGTVYQETEGDLDSMVGTVANSSITLLNNTAVALPFDDVVQGTVVWYNGSIDSTTWLSNNVTINNDLGTATLITNNGSINNTAVNISYSWGNYTIRDNIKNSIVSGFKALNVTGGYLPIVVLAVIILLVLGLVMGFSGAGAGRASYSGAL
jgi:hypothetical protein